MLLGLVVSRVVPFAKSIYFVWAYLKRAGYVRRIIFSSGYNAHKTRKKGPLGSIFLQEYNVPPLTDKATSTRRYGRPIRIITD